MSEIDELSRYQGFRQLHLQVQTAILAKLPQKVVETSAKLLGMLDKGNLYMQSQDDWTLLMDFALFGFRQNGPTQVEEIVPQLPPASNPDEQLMREALTKTRFSIFHLDSVVPNLGLNLLDALRQDSHFLIDQALSRSAPYLTALASRLILLPHFAITTGATLMLSAPLLRLVGQLLAKRFGTRSLDRLTPDENLDMETIILRACVVPRPGARAQ